VLDLRERLRQAYARESSIETKRAAKEQQFAAFRARYAQLRDSAWKGDRRYDTWVAAPLNNASLLPFGLYDRWIAAFRRLFEQAHGAWPLFFAEVGALARQPKAQRDDELSKLTAAAGVLDMQAERTRGSP